MHLPKRYKSIQLLYQWNIISTYTLMKYIDGMYCSQRTNSVYYIHNYNYTCFLKSTEKSNFATEACIAGVQ